MVIDNADVEGLNTFISHYKVCGIDLFETYAKGLGEDFNAVKNAILNRNISNGPIEGINNKIKLIRRTRYGRAKIELINALAVLSSLKRFRYADYAVVKNHCAINLKHGCLGRVA